MKWDLTPEQKKMIWAYRFDRLRSFGGQVIVVVFGILVPLIQALAHRTVIPFWLCLAIAGLGLVLIFTTKAYKDTEEKMR